MIPGVSATGVAQLLVTSIVIIVAPGPSVMFLIGQALGGGLRLALLSVLGHCVGMAVAAVVMTFGVGTVLAREPGLAIGLRIVGGLILVVIGWRYLRARADNHDDLASGVRSVPRRRVLWSSVGVGVTNPKGIIMYAVVVPSFLAPVAPGQSVIPALLLLSSVPLVVGLLCDSLWVVIASLARDWFASSPDRTTGLMRIGGLLIIVLGVLVVVGV